MRVATTLRITSPVPQTSPVPVNEKAAALEFSAIIIPFSAGELAQAGKRTKEAAKAWKAGRSMPSAWSLINMAQEIPTVREWMFAKLGGKPEFASPQVMTVMMAALHQVSKQTGPDGDAVRALLSGADAGRRGES